MTGSKTTNSVSPWFWIVAGTGAAVLGATILFQVFRPEPGSAAEDSAGRSTAKANQSGKTTLNPSGNPATADSRQAAAARIASNGQNLIISLDELKQECVTRVGKEVLDSLINRGIIQLACRRQGVEVSASEVDQEIVRIAQEFRISVEQWLQMLQAERGMTPQQYRRDVIWPMLALKKLAGQDVRVTRTELQTAFEREYGPRVKARMIICDNTRRAIAACEKARQDPHNFEQYVQEYSIDPTSKALDGSVPPIPQHSGNQKLEEAAFKLKPGQVSGVIQLEGSPPTYVVIKCEGRTEPIVTELDDKIQAELIDQIRKQKTQELVAKMFDAIKKDTRIDNYYANTTTGDPKANVASKPSAGSVGAANSARKEFDSSIQPASAKGTPTNRVKPAAATTNDELDLTPPKAPRTSTARPNSNPTR